MLSRPPAAVRLGRARADPLRLRGFRPREHYSTALRDVFARYPTVRLSTQSAKTLSALGWKGWANSRSRIQLVAEHAQFALRKARVFQFSRELIGDHFT
jgi:hypothetical protein